MSGVPTRVTGATGPLTIAYHRTMVRSRHPSIRAGRGTDGPAADGPAADVDAVLFDFGGVLIDSPIDAFLAYERRRGLPEGFIRGVNATNHLENAWARFERNELSFDEFCDAFATETRQAGAEVDARDVFALLTGALRPAMVEALRRLRPHFRTGLLTNNFAVPVAGEDVHHGEVLDLFDVVVASAELGIRKPDPRFYRIACERLAVEPARAVFLDDLGVNLKPARQLGMTTIKVVDVDQAVDDLQAVLGIPLR